MAKTFHDAADHAWTRQLEAEFGVVIGFGETWQRRFGQSVHRFVAYFHDEDGNEVSGSGTDWIDALDSLAYEAGWRTSEQIEDMRNPAEVSLSTPSQTNEAAA